jgi:threonine/homoserine/homoserine lactone efflux protein
MTYQILIALGAFCLASSITPGPNNLMVMASGANFGFARTIPHMLGISIGFAIMVLLVGLGLSQLFQQFPVFYEVLKIISIAYLVYLAWKISRSGSPEDMAEESKPFSFLQAALFQWVNPKAWIMALTAVTLYAPSQSVNSILIIALFFGVLSLPAISVWTVLGVQVKRILTDPLRLRLFNYLMAALLIASMTPVLFE